VSTTLLIKQCGIGNFEWITLGADTIEETVGDIERLAQARDAAASAIYLVPSKDITFRDVSFDDSERKLLRQTLPYSLEDDLVDDVDDLHFSLGSIEDNQVSVALIKSDLLQQWTEEFRQQDIDIQQFIPELLMLPLAENSWSLLIQPQTWLLRYGVNQGFAIDASSAGLALQLLLDESEQLPGSLAVFGAGDNQAAILNQLPDLLSGIVEWRDESYWQMVSAAMDSQSTVKNSKSALINLLQGDFAPSLPWTKWWKYWRVAAVLLISATVLQLLSSYMRVSALEEVNTNLRVDIERSYRTAIPRGAVLDPEKQLRRQVNALKGNSGDAFVGILQNIASVVATTEGLNVQSLNYTEKQSEVRLTVLAENFNDVETMRANLEKQGLEAELTGSSTEGEQTRARLRVRG
jgi:type II secretion system protein L